MNSFGDNAHLILKKWEAEGTRLQAELRGGWFSLSFIAYVKGVSAHVLMLTWGENQISLLLEGATIKYSEPREISAAVPSKIKESAEALFESMLIISFVSGAELSLAAYRDD